MPHLNRPLMGTAHRPSTWQPMPVMDGDQRVYPRIALEIPVAFRNGLGQHCAARLRNLAPDGLQVQCNVVTAQIIHPLGGKIQAMNQSILHATAVLPLMSGPETLSVGVRLVYSATVNEESRCVLGFQFLELRPIPRRLIDAYFAEQIKHLYPDADSDVGHAA